MIKFKRTSENYILKLEDKEGKLHIHIDIFKYNKQMQKDLMEVFAILCIVLKGEGYKEIYFMQEVEDKKLLKFSSMFGVWHYHYTLTLTNGNEYNLLSYTL